MNWDILPCCVYALDQRDKITLWNTVIAETTAIPKESIVGRSAAALPFVHPVERDSIANPFSCVRAGGPAQIGQVIYLKDRENKLRLVFAQAKRMKEPSFPDIDILVLLTDISEEITCDLLELDAEASPFHGIVGKDAKMQEIYRLIRLASESLVNVSVEGESGTGKELAARAIHAGSPRRQRPFVAVHCSSLPETLLESELFGHVKGSFTGAYRDKIGKFELAHGGTVFLDEIGDISPQIQLKLLRVIQEKAIERVGDNQRIDIDMRIITATNKNLKGLVESGSFREDLYYRLRVFPIVMPALRDRKSDILLLSHHFIEQLGRKTGKEIRSLTDNAARLLVAYTWPGNVRELQNALEYAFVLTEGALIDVFDLPQDIRVISLKEESPPNPPRQMRTRRVQFSREELVETLETNDWNKTETARQLAISRVTLWKKLKALGIEG